jgi:hypothetical protein
VWPFRPKRGRCKRCRGPILWVVDDQGHYRPIRPDAAPLEEQMDPEGRTWRLYASDAFHACVKPFDKSPAQAAE